MPENKKHSIVNPAKLSLSAWSSPRDPRTNVSLANWAVSLQSRRSGYSGHSQLALVRLRGAWKPTAQVWHWKVGWKPPNLIHVPDTSHQTHFDSATDIKWHLKKKVIWRTKWEAPGLRILPEVIFVKKIFFKPELKSFGNKVIWCLFNSFALWHSRSFSRYLHKGKKFMYIHWKLRNNNFSLVFMKEEKWSLWVCLLGTCAGKTFTGAGQAHAESANCSPNQAAE